MEETPRAEVVAKARERLRVMNIPLPSKKRDGDPLPPFNLELFFPKIAVTFVDTDAMAGKIILLEGAREQQQTPIAQIVKVPDAEVMSLAGGGWSGNPIAQFLQVGDIVLIGGPVRMVPSSWGEHQGVFVGDIGAVVGFYTTDNGVILTDYITADWDAKTSPGVIVVP